MARTQDTLPNAPFMAWIEETIRVIERDPAYGAGPYGSQAKGASVLATRMGVTDRTLYRWRYGRLEGKGPAEYTDVIDRHVVEEALDNAGVFMWEIYPQVLDEHPDVAEEFCWPCRSFVHPIDDRCPWCETPIVRIDLSALPPRRRQDLENERAAAPSMRIVHKPRVKLPPRPFYLDVVLDDRRRALEVFARTASVQQAAVVLEKHFSSVDSAANSLRVLLKREGWFKPKPGVRGEHAAPQLRTAARKVRQALKDGTWDRVVEQQVSPSQRRAFDEWVVIDAAWLYFYDHLSFRECAERLLPRTSAKGVKILKQLLVDEWNRHGWPRRLPSRSKWVRPKKGSRCTSRHQHTGKPCRRYAQAGKTLCFDHDPERTQERLARNVKASEAARWDAVPLEPMREWLRLQRRQGISMLELHRRCNGVVNYDTLTAWGRPFPRGGAVKIKTIKRGTIDRFLEALGAGVTFEDIYMPVESEHAGVIAA